MRRTIARREFLGLGCAAGGFCLGQGVVPASVQPGQAAMRLPWPYQPLDVGRVKARAYAGYFKLGCMYGVFEGVACSVAEILGKPYTDFPFELASYGGGGVASWGTLCGTCNGAAMAIALFHQGELRTKLTGDLFSWYEGTALPSFVPDAPVKVDKEFKMPASRSGSVLCHVSIARWSKAAMLPASSPRRLERCARIVADVAGHVTEALNAAHGEYQPRTLGEAAGGCLTCHGGGKQGASRKEVVARMECTDCHKHVHQKQ